ncbi:type IV conjugative transfer system pilin TraA [Providencia rettgeri]
MAEITLDNSSTRKKGLFKRAIAAINFNTGKALFRVVGLPLMAFLVSKGAMAADDMLASGREDADASFGADSTLMYYFMLAEVVLVFLMYLKTQNPATFIYIPVFFVVTGIIFAIVNSRAPGA